VICENNFHEIAEYFTPRNIGALAAGSCALMRVFPGIEKHFQNLVHCIYYHDEFELLEWIYFLNNNPTFRNNIAGNGFSLANTNFTAKQWARELSHVLKKYIG
jgi:spore maturation protein CgeB